MFRKGSRLETFELDRSGSCGIMQCREEQELKNGNKRNFVRHSAANSAGDDSCQDSSTGNCPVVEADRHN